MKLRVRGNEATGLAGGRASVGSAPTMRQRSVAPTPISVADGDLEARDSERWLHAY
jgi:hypothetical protein